MRRLQALAVVGWPTARLSRETGLSPGRLDRLLAAAVAVVSASEARAVAAAFTRLGGASPGLCGVSHIAARAARNRAGTAGWAPPAAWDDDTIDDPAAIPQWTGHCGTTRGADIHDRDGLPRCPPCQAALDRHRPQQRHHARRA
ncbi:hypothetical protein [Streptomyces sp. SID8352]|uniref:hypothetical protein n=1 Tax=Streptomyces sp. SID8352 TaxID=2690338 RepID=UPI001368A1EB|nr:hypothetical protein [Streptomyces sp. SID8352]MYU24510.1 hypothetical protein [Streptomyces sp. SID8352]